jgi:hypothetical protein
MIESLLGDPDNLQLDPDGNPYPLTVLGYQQWHNAKAQPLEGYEQLDEDGKIGPDTRKQLILDYMHREGTTVPQGTPILVHGCGEYFPLESTGENLDTNAADGKHEQEDRRVEVYLFPRELGVLPPVPGEKAKKGEKEYAEWRGRATEFDLSTISDGTLIYLLDAEGHVLPTVPCRIVTGPLSGMTLTANADGAVDVPSAAESSGSFILEWSHPAYPEDFVYSCQVTLNTSSEDVALVRAEAILQNLGYLSGGSLDTAVRAFQRDYNVDADPAPTGLVDGQVPAATFSRLEEIQTNPVSAQKA